MAIVPQQTSQAKGSRWYTRLLGGSRSGSQVAKQSRSLKGVVELAKFVRKEEHALADLSETQFRDRAIAARESAAEKGVTDQAFFEWGGIVAESVFRTNGFRMHDVQVQAMIAGTSGAIVEMQTGEGKTVVTGATAAMKLLDCVSVHVGTTNAYLAERDMEENTAAFDLLGITYGILPDEHNEALSRAAYRQEIVYGPGYQYGFDYLFDQMNLRQNRQSVLGVKTMNRIRGLNPTDKLIQVGPHDVALIDEADSVMIDEAMTPLIISLPSGKSEDVKPYLLAQKITSEFEIDVDYTIKMPGRLLELTDQANRRGHDAIAKHRDLQLSRPWKVYLSNAVRARELYKRDIDYVVRDEAVQIVDQYTGRIFADRTWQAGLHQAIEVKEKVEMQAGRESTTTITRQRYLQMYDQLAGLTGTASSVRKEFQVIYNCNVIEIPTNKTSLRRIDTARFFADLESKLAAIAVDVAERHKTGQPILVGTRTIEESIQIKESLTAMGLSSTLLNGVQDEEEADIVAEAGKMGQITIATNMAGRGTNIKPAKEALSIGGLHVVGVSPNPSRRIDRQLVGRAARQGQPGSAQFFACSTDQIFVENDSPLCKLMVKRANAQGEAPDYTRDLANLQSAIEARNFKQRQDMILQDCWMDTVREAIEKD